MIDENGDVSMLRRHSRKLSHPFADLLVTTAMINNCIKLTACERKIRNERANKKRRTASRTEN